MKFIKFLLALLAVGVGVWLVFWLLGAVYAIAWYLFFAGIIGIGGYAGYKFFLEPKRTKELPEKKPTAIAEIENADRTLEEYKSKYLPK